MSVEAPEWLTAEQAGRHGRKSVILPGEESPELREISAVTALDSTARSAGSSAQQRPVGTVATNVAERRQSANPESYVDVTVAARFLSVSSKTLNQLAREGKVPAYPWGVGMERRSWRFKLSELDTWMQGRLKSNRRPPRKGRTE